MAAKERKKDRKHKRIIENLGKTGLGRGGSQRMGQKDCQTLLFMLHYRKEKVY